MVLTALAAPTARSGRGRAWTAFLVLVLAVALAVAAFVPLGPVGQTVLVAAIALCLGGVALTFSGGGAWLAGVGAVAYLVALYAITGERSIGLLMFTAPGYVGGTVLRLHREAAERLARTQRELEEERELFSRISVQHERARIAAELHDIVGHAVSVMVVQAAAGQRLADTDPDGARGALRVISEAAQQGRDDLGQLVQLLGGTEVEGPGLAMVEELVHRAASSGLDVRVRFEGDLDGTTGPVAQLAFRSVQEGVTNALRHAPGAAVRVTVAGKGRGLVVRVENDRPGGDQRLPLQGAGRGLRGLRERAEDLGGSVRCGPTPGGGWFLETRLA